MNQIEMIGITKRFGSTVANDKINFSVRKGEIHSLLGENGAGKTTLMRILYGLSQPDEGDIYINNAKVFLRSPLDAIDAGIAMVHQHFMLLEPLTVAENMVLGKEPRRGIRFDFGKAISEVSEISKRYHLEVDPRTKVEDLPIGMKQRVEILKALYRKTETLILDEPTAVLTPNEVSELFQVLTELRQDGKTIILITHKLKETMAIADRVTILAGGKLVTTRNVSDTNPRELAELMVGRKVSFAVNRSVNAVVSDKPVLQLKNICYKKDGVNKLNNLSLTLREGEILGIAGVEGNGQTELAELIGGLIKADSGSIVFFDKEISNATARMMLNLGIGSIPEDRGKRGLVKEFQIQENIIFGYHHRKPYSSKGLLNLKAVRTSAEKIANDFDIRLSSVDAKISSLSGGNQQKVVVARALSQDPAVIVAAQPTRGVDIGAIEYIHQKLIEYKEQSKSIILISAELDELFKLSDRIAVLYAGSIVATDLTSKFNEYRLSALMAGLEG